MTDRIAVITGASAGIGEAIAHSFSKLGYKLVLNARREEKLKELLSKLGEDTVEIVPGDCAESSVIKKLLDTSKSRFGSEADIVVVNAGRGLQGSILTSDEAQWAEVIRTNILGALLLMRESAKRMVAQIESEGVGKRPRDLIILGSTVGRHISPFSSLYGSTKFAVNSSAEALRRELGPKGIRVSLLEPGIVVSEFQSVAGYQSDWFNSFADKFSPLLQPDDIARSVAFIVEQPWHVHVNDLMIRPTRQDYP